MSRTVRLLGLSGSLRKQSAHTAVLCSVAESLPETARLDVHGLEAIPPYNEDCDGANTPLAVLALREAVARADGLLIGSPEYNHGMSGVLKNALDWLSRPHGQSVLSGRAVLTFTASPAFTGGVRAHQQLNETLWAIQAVLVAYPQIVIGGVGGKIRDGQLVDEATRSFLLGGVERLIECALGGRAHSA
ncbi:Chromate reductase [Pseudomonas reidholzensis]|uniref:Chromate reductase n=1 Tax=Pseudomonas reidholzensis TaxID=1785162 RepID=A0A383RUM0_9PSED|nr:NAD(P)H-dependent oxidoreductase [Pseudomonas reidholzensis]SYX90473.1 Chromate reductase [Pseudomonas reidholzensis]